MRTRLQCDLKEALKRHADVEDALVFGVPDDRFGQRVSAVVSLSPGRSASTEDILSDTRRRLSSFSFPGRSTLWTKCPAHRTARPITRRARELFLAGRRERVELIVIRRSGTGASPPSRSGRPRRLSRGEHCC